jgi:tetratricopeptide (TPR) repeat protein
MNTFLPMLLAGVCLASAADTANVDALIENGHLKRARPLAEALYKANASDAHANYCMGRVETGFNHLDEAIRYAEAAVKLDPKSAVYHRWLGEAYGQQIDQVSMMKQFGVAKKMRAEFEAALALDPKNHDNILNMIEYYLQAPGMFGGDKKKAHQMADDEVKSNPSSGYLSQARIATIEKDSGKLDGFYRKAAEADPKNYDAQITLALFMVNGASKDFIQAEQHAKVAIDLNPDRISGYRLLAYALASQKRVDDAAKAITRSEAAIPDDLSPYVYGARGLLAQGVEFAHAETWLKKYLAETKEPELGAPLIAGTHWSMGLVYEKENRKPEAIAELQTALRIKPEFEPAKKDLKRITGK